MLEFLKTQFQKLKSFLGNLKQKPKSNFISPTAIPNSKFKPDPKTVLTKTLAKTPVKKQEAQQNTFNETISSDSVLMGAILGASNRESESKDNSSGSNFSYDTNGAYDPGLGDAANAHSSGAAGTESSSSSSSGSDSGSGSDGGGGSGGGD